MQSVKRLMSVLLCIALILCTIPFQPRVHAATSTVSTLSELQSALSTANGGDIIYLDTCIEVSTVSLNAPNATKGNPVKIKPGVGTLSNDSMFWGNNAMNVTFADNIVIDAITNAGVRVQAISIGGSSSGKSVSVTGARIRNASIGIAAQTGYGSVLIQNCEVTNCKDASESPSAAVTTGGFNTKILSCNITDNESGGIYAYASGTGTSSSRQILIQDSTVIRNTSTKNGGGIKIDGSADMGADAQIINTKVQYNSTTEKGGGISDELSGYKQNHGTPVINFTIKDCEITHNYSSKDGGGLWSSDLMGGYRKTFIEDTVFADNTAEINGGGMYLSGTTSASNSPTRNIKNGVSIYRNKAVTGVGGGIYAGNLNTVNIDHDNLDSLFTGNTSTRPMWIENIAGNPTLLEFGLANLKIWTTNLGMTVFSRSPELARPFTSPFNNYDIAVRPETIAGLYTITATSTEGGNAASDYSDAPSGQQITVTATPADNFTFKEWEVVSGAPFTIAGNMFTMPARNVEVNAVFEALPFNIFVQNDGNGSAGSDVSEALEGDTVTLTASPNTGYKFKEWQVVSGGPLTIGTDNKFAMPANDVTVKAIFELDDFNIIVQNDGNGTASASVSKAKSGDIVTLTANPSTNYVFKEWQVISGAPLTINADNTFTMPPRDVTVKAIFEIAAVEYNVTVQNDGNGSAYSSVSKAKSGDIVTLTATPSSGYAFKEWQVISGSPLAVNANNTFTMPARDVTVKAVFIDTNNYPITVQNDGNGTAISNVPSAKAGDVVQLTAAPIDGYTFKEWQVISGGITVAANNTFIMPANAVVVRAVFTENTKYPITVQNDGNGTASANVATAKAGDVIQLSASPSAGYEFKGWQVVSGGITVAGNNTFVMPVNAVTVKALFAEKSKYTITVQNDGNGAAASNVPSAKAGDMVQLTATPKAGYDFKEWRVVSGGITVAGDNTFVMPANSVTVKAIFSEKPKYNVIIQTDGNGTASASVSQAKNGDTVALTASPNAGYIFNEWQVVSGGVTIAGNNTFIMPGQDVTVKAIFTASYVSVDDDEPESESEAEKGSIVIRASEIETNTPVEGAVYGIYRKSDGLKVGEIKTGKNGTKEVLLKYGDYYVKGLKPPAGYEFIDKKVEFRVIETTRIVEVKLARVKDSSASMSQNRNPSTGRY